MRHRLDEVRKLLGLLMVLRVLYFWLVVDILFIQFLLLFLLLRMRLVGLGQEGVVRILCYLVVGRLYLVRLVLKVVISFQTPQ